MLPLEEWLKSKAKNLQTKSRDFPTTEDYFTLYDSQKSKLIEHIYPHINAGLITFGEGGKQIYTDHGLSHIEAVIKIAGKLLGCERKSSKIALSPYEVFLLLMAILGHDAGNIEGRDEHEIKVAKILNSQLTKTLSNSSEIGFIHEIAKAHTAKGLATGGKDKDTMPDLKSEDDFRGITFRPRIIASLLRLSDEICEDQSRIPQYLLNEREDIKTGPSAPYLYYGNSISSVKIDATFHNVSIKIEIDENQIIEPIEFEKLDGRRKSIYLINEVLERLEKTRNEWVYCYRYLRGIIVADSLLVTISILVNNIREHKRDIIDIKTINLAEEGYPESKKPLKEMDERFDSEKLKMTLNTERQRRSTNAS